MQATDNKNKKYTDFSDRYLLKFKSCYIKKYYYLRYNNVPYRFKADDKLEIKPCYYRLQPICIDGTRYYQRTHFEIAHLMKFIYNY